jgi:phage tail-like protein
MSKEMNAPYFPAVAFHFGVWVDGISGGSAKGATADASFQEVSGIKVEFAHDDVVEGGENRFVHRLPKPATQQNLVLKRGVVVETSRLAQWVSDTLGSTFAKPIVPRTVLVMLRNEKFQPLITWAFINAYPVRWDVSPLDSLDSKVLTETIELSYAYFTRRVSVPRTS